MTVHDLLEYGEYHLREDKEYWEEMGKLKCEIERLIDRHNKIMAATIIRLAVAMIAEKHSDSKCADCVGGYCEEDCGVPLPHEPCVSCKGGDCEICTEGKDNDEE